MVWQWPSALARVTEEEKEKHITGLAAGGVSLHFSLIDDRRSGAESGNLITWRLTITFPINPKSVNFLGTVRISEPFGSANRNLRGAE
jgi:hypothetical protein